MDDQPDFRTVIRGYDPQQVNAVLSEVNSSLMVARRTAAQRTVDLARAKEQVASLSADLDEAVARLAAAETTTPPRQGDFGELGTRVTSILTLAGEEAGQVRAEAERYADQLRRDAQTAATRMKREATKEAGDIVAAATKEAATRRKADEQRHARVADAERQAGQIIEQARRDAQTAGREVIDGLGRVELDRDNVHAHLREVLQLLDTLDAELAEAAR